jgi:hypothetical protein
MSKAISLDERISIIHRAFEKRFVDYDAMTLQPWIADVFDTYLIVNEGPGVFFRVEYSLDEGEPGVMFQERDEWQAVSREFVLKSMRYPVLVGGSLKALGDGKFGGHLVRFTSANEHDLEGDFFDARTDYDLKDGEELSIYYHHGLDPVLKNRRLDRKPVKFDDAGIWIEGQLNLRDAYENYIYDKLIVPGKAGFSSGPAMHLVRREWAGKAHHLTHWPVKEASITPIPADFRNVIAPLKSFPFTTFETLIPGPVPDKNPVIGDDRGGTGGALSAVDAVEIAQLRAKAWLVYTED